MHNDSHFTGTSQTGTQHSHVCGSATGFNHFRSRRNALLFMAAAACFGSVGAQTKPPQKLTIIVPYAVGGVADVYARVIANGLSKRWGGVPVIVDNRAGGGTTIGSQLAARAPADGTTLLFTSAAFTTNQVLMKQLPYNPASLKPLYLLGTSVNMLVVNPAVPAKDVAQLIALAKARPGGLKLASAGNGTSPHITAMLFANKVGIDIVHVAYKGSAPAMNDVAAGVTDGMFEGVGSMPLVRAGKLRALAVTSAERNPNAPDVPTFRELGIDLVYGSWYGFLLPAATPSAMQQQLAQDLRSVIESPEARAQLTTGGLQLRHMEQDDFSRYLQSELDKFKKLAAAYPSDFKVE